MTRATNRAATKKRLFDLVSTRAGALPGVVVSYGHPKQGIPKRGIAVGTSVTGTQSDPLMQEGRKSRDDTFTIVVKVWQLGEGVDEIEADESCLEVFSCVEEVVAEDPTLGGLDGLRWAVLARVDGPTPLSSDEGYVSTMEVEVSCRSRLS